MMSDSRLRRLFRVTVAVCVVFFAVVVLSGCPPGPDIPPPPPRLVDLKLDVEAILIGEVDGDSPPIESFPFYLRFDVTLHDGSLGRCGDVQTPARLSALSLKELRYTLIDRNDIPFFTDNIVLYGSHGPGTLIVEPGLTAPEESDRISIQAELAFEALAFGANCVETSVESTAVLTGGNVTVDIRAIPVGARYERISSSYKRRHLLGQGRNLSSIWLKEFDPARDRKELLSHSRTLRFPDDDRTRVFVPWVFECHKRPPLPLNDGTEEIGCGRSIHGTSVSIYAGGENPLLRGGLAMAAFALEARRYLQDTSLDVDERNRLASHRLRPAMKLLDHVEASEWIDPDGRPTGFFLRGDRPGKIDGHTGRTYMFASIDELSGMVLGLYQLHETLRMMGATPGAFRVRDLIHRMGVRLRDNHYFILPYRRETEKVTVTIGGEVFWSTQTPRWRPIGLPEERHRGWSGSFGFEWFLNRALENITGYRYHPPAITPVYVVENVDIPLQDAIAQYIQLIRDHFHIPSWVPIDEILSWVPDDAVLNFLRSNTVMKDWVPADLIGTEADLFEKVFKAAPDKTGKGSESLDWLMGFVVKRDISAAERAIYAIQALGILAYYDATEDRRYPLCQNLESQHFLPPNSCLAALVGIEYVAVFRYTLNLLFGSLLPEQVNVSEPLDVSAVTQGIRGEPPYWNNPMLMTLFQAANPNAGTADPEVIAIRREMARFIKGLLVHGGVRTNVELDKLIPEEVIPFTDIPDIFAELVGRPDRDPDYYAAAIARMFNLPAEFPDVTNRQEFENGIQWATQTIEASFAGSSPIAEPLIGYCAEEPDAVCSPVACSDDTDPNAPCNRCGDKGPCNVEDWAQVVPSFQPAPFSENDKVPFGKEFIWERRPRSGIRHMEADRFGGLVVDEIHSLYRIGEVDRSSRYIVLKEGAGLGFLLPYAMLGRPLMDLYEADEFLPACYTNPVLEANTEIDPSEKCRYWYNRMSPDRFDQRVCEGGQHPGERCLTDFECGSGGICSGDRNDSFNRAVQLTIGTRVRPNTDNSTDGRYWQYAVFRPAQGELREIPPEMDYDFFYFDNPARENVQVTMKYLHYPGEVIKRLFIDGKEQAQDTYVPCEGPDPCLRTLSALIGGKTRHTLMVMGDIGEYEVLLERVP